MHDDVELVRRRVERLLAERLRPAVVIDAVECPVEGWAIAGEPVTFGEARGATFQPMAAGDPWGPPWSTLWLRIKVVVPPWYPTEEAELMVDLGFDGRSPGFQAEGLAFDSNGHVLKGIAPRSAHIPLALLGAKGGDEFVVFVEAASNPSIGLDGDFRPTQSGRRASAGNDPERRLGRIELQRCDLEMRALCLDVEVLLGLANELDPRSGRRYEIVRALGAMADAVGLEDIAARTAEGRAALAEALSAPATTSAHVVVATGHAHIDSAWLWPLRESVRKCARTFSNVLALIEEHPELRFSCSQAQQYAWVRDSYPELFERIRTAVAAGSFVPVGGTWVEPDGNLCGSEALARQLILGRRLFAKEFGRSCPEVWLPDSFGYSAAWPQLAKLAGAKYFLTQKLSWNQTNAFPHSTFLWEGIDGTRILTHFPPVATYNSELTPAELARASRDFAEHGRSGRSLVPFGYGDGGGGPTREMLERARRQASLEGSPRVKLGTSEEFFDTVAAEYEDPPVWAGELYLELHRATFTSQARLKRGNRRSEHLLREAEIWSSASLVFEGAVYPHDELQALWEEVLLLQFHDILPGSSIGWVNDEAIAAYDDIEARLKTLIEGAIATIVHPGVDEILLSSAPVTVSGVPPFGATLHEPVDPGRDVFVETSPEGTVLDNGLLRVVVDHCGLIASVRDLLVDREVLAPDSRANLLQLHLDQPNAWDAWDVDAFYRNATEDLINCSSLTVEGGRDYATVVVERDLGRGLSRARQSITLRRGAHRVEFVTEVDWREHERFLKVAFPLDLRAEYSSSEIQFGHVRRPVHVNTSWDAARFEIWAHRWIHVGEAGFGVAIANDATYGHDVTRTTRDDGSTTTTVRLSLLRAPRFPDPAADNGHHRFAYVLVPNADIADAVAEGYRLNLPPRRVLGARVPASLVVVDDGGRRCVVVETVKAADDRSGDVVMRMYESLGGRGRATISPGFACQSVQVVDLLEAPIPDARPLHLEGGGFVVDLRPFEILSVICRRGSNSPVL